MKSASELDYHLLLARDLHFLEADCHHDLMADLVQVQRMLAPFIRRLRSTSQIERLERAPGKALASNP